MKNTKIALALAVSSTLAACGSSGGGSGALEPSVSHKVKPVYKEINSADIHTLKLDDKTITLLPVGFKKPYLDASNGTYNGKPTTRRAVAVGFSSSIGVVMQKGKDVVVFNQGERTPESIIDSRSGTAIYYGPYINYNSNSDTVAHGTLGARVDFGGKKIEFEDKTPVSTTQITLPAASISGNSFTFNDNNGKGYFYGSDVKDMGGIYQKGASHTTFTLTKDQSNKKY